MLKCGLKLDQGQNIFHAFCILEPGRNTTNGQLLKLIEFLIENCFQNLLGLFGFLTHFDKPEVCQDFLVALSKNILKEILQNFTRFSLLDHIGAAKLKSF